MDGRFVTKKRRLISRKRDANAARPDRTALRFDEISDAATENIIKHLARVPNHEADWHDHIPLSTALALLRSGGSLRRVAKDNFGSVTFTTIKGHHFEDSGVALIEGDPRHMLSLIKELRDGVHTLKVCARLASSFVHSVANHCSKVRNLSIQTSVEEDREDVSIVSDDSFDALLRALGPALESLALYGFDPSIKKNRALTYCRNLRHLKISNPCDEGWLDSVWKTAGDRLQHLEIEIIFEPSEIGIECLLENCRSISRLGLDVNFDECVWESEGSTWYGAMETICISYGSQLLGLTLPSWSKEPTELRSISQACPNLRVDFHSGWVEEGHSTDVALALGHAALAWSMPKSEKDQNDGLTRVGATFPNLRIVKLYLNNSLKETRFADFLFQTRFTLRNIHICIPGVLSTASVLSILTETVSLEGFRLEAEVLPPKMLRSFILSQKKLKYIWFYAQGLCQCPSRIFGFRNILDHSKDMVGSWPEVVTICLENRGLESIQCYCYNPTEYDFCREPLELRHRSTFVTDCGFDQGIYI